MDLQTILTSAGTAAVVTLLVEYAAKPKLEARKDRIVENARQRRKLGIELISIFSEASRLKFEASTQWPREHWENPVNELEQKLAQAESALLGASSTLKKEQLSSILRPLVSARTTCGTIKNLITYGLSDDSESKHLTPAFATIARNAYDATVRVEVPRWRVLKYRKLIKRTDANGEIADPVILSYFADLPDNRGS